MVEEVCAGGWEMTPMGTTAGANAGAALTAG